MTTKTVSKEQEEEFKRRLANRQPSNNEAVELPHDTLEAFLKSTDEKCE